MGRARVHEGYTGFADTRRDWVVATGVGGSFVWLRGCLAGLRGSGRSVPSVARQLLRWQLLWATIQFVERDALAVEPLADRSVACDRVDMPPVFSRG